MSSLPSLRARELLALLRELAPAQPVLVWSRPGAGKSALVGRAAAALGLEVLAVPAASLPGPRAPEELTTPGGFHAPRMTARPRPVLLHVPGAEDATYAGALEALVDERRLGRFRLPEGSPLVAEARWVGAAGSPGAPPGVAARFLQVVLEPDVEDWLPWAADEGLAPAVLRYLRGNPTRLAPAPVPGEPTSCPRSWEAVGRALAATTVDPWIQAALLRGLLAPADSAALVSGSSLTACPAAPTVLREPGGPHGRRRDRARGASPSR